MQKRKKYQPNCYCANKISHSRWFIDEEGIFFGAASDNSELDHILVLLKPFHLQVSFQSSVWGVLEPFGVHDYIFYFGFILKV